MINQPKTPAELAKNYPSPVGRVVVVPLELVPAYYQLHGIKPYQYVYSERAYDEIMIVKKKDADDLAQEADKPVR